MCDAFNVISAVITERSKLDQVVFSSKLHTAPKHSLTLLGLSIGECSRIKETKTFIDGLGHRGLETVTERERRLFMSIHDQCDQAMFGVFLLDQQLINQPQRLNSPGISNSAEGDILTTASLLTSIPLSPCLLRFAE